MRIGDTILYYDKYGSESPKQGIIIRKFNNGALEVNSGAVNKIVNSEQVIGIYDTSLAGILVRQIEKHISMEKLFLIMMGISFILGMIQTIVLRFA